MHVGKQNHNSGSMHDPMVYQQKTVGKIASKGLQQRISLVVSRIGGKPHWIHATQSWSMEGARGRRYCTHRFGTGKRMCAVVSRRTKHSFPGFYEVLFILTLRKDCQKCYCPPIAKNLVLENRDESALRGHVASVSPTFN